jgi:hypothetical protein
MFVLSMDEWFNDFVIILLQLVAVESIFNSSNKLYFFICKPIGKLIPIKVVPSGVASTMTVDN